MTIGDIHNRLPQATPPLADLSGYTEKFLFFPKNRQLAKTPFLKGVVFIGFEFVDGKVSAIMLGYDNSLGWTSGEQFVKQISVTLGIQGQWEKMESPDRPLDDDWRIKCGGQSFIAGLDWHGSVATPMVGWFDDAATQVINDRNFADAKRRWAEVEAKRKAFKP